MKFKNRLMLLAATALLPAMQSFAQTPKTGDVLVATAAMTDPTFAETVILLVHHSDEGSFGLFLNRPTWVDGGEQYDVLAPVEDAAVRTLNFGGPVAMSQLLSLSSASGTSESTNEVLAGVFLSTDIEDAVDSGGRLRVFAGHTVWSEDQLQNELDDGYWQLTEGTLELIFDTPAEQLLERAQALVDGGLVASVP